jgi:hypothetical protein
MYGQKVLKGILRKILWTLCYSANMTLTLFNDSKKINRDVEMLLDSGMLSGGLPVECFGNLFSSEFNKQFITLVHTNLIL